MSEPQKLQDLPISQGELTLADKDEIRELLKMVQQRADMLKQMNSDLPKCPWCNNCVDVTPLMGQDTVCPYHRLLHDEYFYDQGGSKIHPDMPYEGVCKTIDEYRAKFNEWMKKMGQDHCDLIVADKARLPVNWQC